MAIVKRVNKELTVADNDVAKYLEMGYDQINEKGVIQKKATSGREYSIAEVEKLLSEYKDSKKKSELKEGKKKEE